MNRIKAWLAARLKALRTFIGGLWGATTTLIFTVSGSLVGIMSEPSVSALLDLVPKVRFGLTVFLAAAGVLRVLCPPPPAVAITEGTNATVVDAHTMIVQTATPLPDATVQAANAAPEVGPVQP